MTTSSVAPFQSATVDPPPTGRLAKNAGILLVGQMSGLVVPLVTIPYLARVLGPAAWGAVFAAQALGNWLVVILEFGFDFSGTRAVARARAAPETMDGVVHGVQSAKMLLTLWSLPVAALCLFAIPSIRENATLVAWAVAFAVLRGFSPLWFFQGVERVRGAVAVDAVSRAAAALGVFVLVHGPADGWRVLALQTVFSALSLGVLSVWLAKHVRLRRPAKSAGLVALKEGSSIFACRAWSGLYIQGNALILSALAGPVTVALFGGAERIIRAAINLLQPLTQVFLPHVSHLQAADPARAAQVVRRTIVGLGLLGLGMGLCATFGAPLLIHLLLGRQYDGAIPVLRIMGTLPVLVALNTVFGLYWALPYGRERLLLASVIAAGVTNVSLAAALVPRWGATGMAFATVLAEIVSLGVLAWAYVRRAR